VIKSDSSTTPARPDWLPSPDKLERIRLESHKILETLAGQSPFGRSEIIAALGFDEDDFDEDNVMGEGSEIIHNGIRKE
jgi:hypothetical protein